MEAWIWIFICLVASMAKGGVFVVVWCSTGVVLEWCFCGHVFLVVFFVVMFLWWCFCGVV